MDRVKGCLSDWKERLLNRVERVTLAKSILSSILIYSMQNMWLPQGICDELDKITRRFIWGSSDHNHWMKWKTLTQRRHNRGLGIRTTWEANVAILGKHIWTMLHDPSKL